LSADAGPGGRRLRLGALAAGLALGLALVLMVAGMEVSSKPQFCGTCHVMAPYYQSWRTSRHSQVACVECHIPPGLTAEFRKKYEALSMVARYFTATYGTNPWTEIEDAACLRCHERRLISGQEVFGQVLFDHRPHLNEIRRGTRLRCTSCHSQIVQGSHIAVTTSTCILCHFKGEQAGRGTARCTLCHQVPQQVVSPAGARFNHADVSRYDMQCTSCHAHAASGEGQVPRERCLSCHNEPARLAAIGEVERLHRAHVADRKVDCLQCHLEIEHRARPPMEAAASGCESCHASGHSPQRDLYAGIGGKGVQPMPSAMFSAGVRCEGCHFVGSEDGAPVGVARATEVSCMSCHGPRYRAILRSWKRGVEQRAGALRAAADELERGRAASASQALLDARANLALVERGRGVHNVGYAFALLERTHDYLNEERARRGLPARQPPWPRSSASSACSQCHAGIESQSGEFGGARFEHGRHLQEGLDCKACHRAHEERSKDEVVRFGPEGCDQCHHARVGAQAKVADCAPCHADVSARTLPTERGDFAHAMHLELVGADCSTCHALAPGKAPLASREACAACHS
jgi:nitrate/TMAO reductase-like tetraheme cytochrome c subunit